MYTLSWDEETRLLESIDGIEALLDGLHTRFSDGKPTLVTIERDGTRDSLSIGLGLDVSVLNHVRADKNPPYSISVGRSNRDEPIAFLFGGEWSEYPIRNTVPISAARAAMRKFCETGELTKDVVWEEV